MSVVLVCMRVVERRDGGREGEGAYFDNGFAFSVGGN